MYIVVRTILQINVPVILYRTLWGKLGLVDQTFTKEAELHIYTVITLAHCTRLLKNLARF
jgi:hypothetical protein